MRFGSLGLPCWHSRRIHTVTNSSDDSSHNELTKRERRALKNSPNCHYCRADPDRLSSSKNIAQPDGHKRAHEAPEIVRSDGNSLDS